MRRLKNAISDARGMMNSLSGVIGLGGASGLGISITSSSNAGSSKLSSPNTGSSNSAPLVSDQMGDLAALIRDRDGLGGMMSILGIPGRGERG